MKTNYSLSPLNLSFEKLKTSHIKNNDGSITPRTTTNKRTLDTVQISPKALELYNENILKKGNDTFLKLNQDIEQNIQKCELLDKLTIMDKKYEKDLNAIKEENFLIGNKLELIKKSQLVQIKDISEFGFETIYQEDIEINKNDIRQDVPTVLRYGLNTESDTLKNIVGSYIEKGVLHPYEEAIFKEAINYLKIVESTEQYAKDAQGYPNNVVLVDIFDRSKGFINEGHNQTHTIALWKKKDNEFVLIDPSNVSFSSDIVKILKINSMIVPGNQIYFPGNNKTGYSYYSEILPKPRDCIDIAVKIGFELNELQKQKVDIKNIENNLLANIANTKAANKLIRAIGFDQCHVREFQSSNQEIRMFARKTITDDGNFIKSMSRLDSLTQYEKVLEIVTRTNLELESLNVKICPTKDVPTGKINI